MTDTAETSAPEPGTSWLSRPHAIMVVFFCHALTGGVLFPRIPDIQLALGLSEGELGIMLMGQPIGAFTSILFASWLIEKAGPKRILMIAVPIITVATTALALAPGLVAGLIAMLVYGLSFSAANMAMNVEADRIEAATGQRIMNRCHGIWSLGFLVAALGGALARGIPVSPLVNYAVLVPTIFVVLALSLWPMAPSPARAHAGPVQKKKVFALPTGNTILLSLVIFAAVMPDMATRAWSVIFMRDTFDAPDWVDALTLPCFSLLLTVGRLFGDGAINRFGAVRCAASLLSLAFAGLALVLLASDLVAVLIGFALMGIGTSILFPLVMSSAARLGDRPASENVTAISLVTNLVMLGTPALFGFIAEGFGIRATFWLLAPVMLVALVLTPRLAASERD